MESIMNCQFCNPHMEKIVVKNDLSYAMWDQFPVNNGHLLIIPFRHTENYFTLTFEEKSAILMIIDKSKEIIDKKFKPAGYNIGFNVGKVAGQTIMHCHCHLIPRYFGDVSEPRGGVRGVIPEKKNY